MHQQINGNNNKGHSKYFHNKITTFEKFKNYLNMSIAKLRENHPIYLQEAREEI
jgi:hypothetical protein